MYFNFINQKNVYSNLSLDIWAVWNLVCASIIQIIVILLSFIVEFYSWCYLSDSVSVVDFFQIPFLSTWSGPHCRVLQILIFSPEVRELCTCVASVRWDESDYIFGGQRIAKMEQGTPSSGRILKQFICLLYIMLVCTVDY